MRVQFHLMTTWDLLHLCLVCICLFRAADARNCYTYKGPDANALGRSANCLIDSTFCFKIAFTEPGSSQPVYYRDCTRWSTCPALESAIAIDQPTWKVTGCSDPCTTDNCNSGALLGPKGGGGAGAGTGTGTGTGTGASRAISCYQNMNSPVATALGNLTTCPAATCVKLVHTDIAGTGTLYSRACSPESTCDALINSEKRTQPRMVIKECNMCNTDNCNGGAESGPKGGTGKGTGARLAPSSYIVTVTATSGAVLLAINLLFSNSL